ncbi:3-hydroxyacyl-CoA dehydrogenase NAD-binding domain-containing protein [Dongia sedimenti]|uniref:3-hydroxyacyl-CoA dehydrogenase NAD-binding domain-containing protein n=1 Tax=Dongia sedimenti TaxID=3064282 RepID=A0ABU0YSX5_9PROT|nr:3-hydroxyacyl-CoA dehydrogenase NAD-binding domain-containing protein [Rhodospirillaceae bacterium R-7]
MTRTAVEYAHHQRIALVTIDNPPVNAINLAVRNRLMELVREIDLDPAIDAAVLMGAGKVFVGGADINEFGRPVEAPTLPEVIARIEGARKPWVAAVHGVALGGGLEITLGCRYRIASPDAKLGLPEVNLGIIPGAGGTQRLPRLIGLAEAIPVIAEMKTLAAKAALALGLVDSVIEGDRTAAAVAFAQTVLAKPLPALCIERPLTDLPSETWSEVGRRIEKAAKGNPAPHRAIEAIRHGVGHGIEAGLKQERAIFLELRGSREAAALRHLFFAERAAMRPARLREIAPLPLNRAGIVGGGTMGVGIAAALRGAGLPVILVERDAEAVQRTGEALENLLAARARRSGDPATAALLMRDVTLTTSIDDLKDCDLVVEAVFEDLAVKRDVFARLDAGCRADAILATNTSYLDPRRLADGLRDPGRLLGIHFFSPAHIMKLLEIVPTPDTRPEVLATAFSLAQRLGKIPVQSGICEGFIGNRILRRYRGEAEALWRSGIAIEAIDGAMRAFGFAMGPFEVQDLAGLDISYLQREAARARGETVPEAPGDILVRAGRKGQKSGGGWYDYVSGDRTPRVSPETARLLSSLLNERREMASAEIAERLVAAMADEGGAIIAEGIAAGPNEVDLVEVHGYGFPRWKGGPMFYRNQQAS